MNIGLIDADLYWRPKKKQRRQGKSKADIYPNIALMKLSAWHKKRGDLVEWYEGFRAEPYDKVYISKVFSDTPDAEYINANEVIRGGSGYNIKLVEGREQWTKNETCQEHLPDEVEHIMPDYSLYGISDTAYGFLSRGCPRGCSFCHVAAKEGKKSYKVADLSEWWGGGKKI